jgi:succinate dehydrogenase / fumarate reductase flavoprotein subunit
MQGLADGYFVIPYSIGNYIANTDIANVDNSHQAFKEALSETLQGTERLLAIKGKRMVEEIHKELGKIMWEYCGMSRSKEGLEKALTMIPELRNQFWNDVNVTGDQGEFNQQLEKAGRVADFLEMGELMVRDALTREESCGGHFREEHQTPENEAKRNDDQFCHVAAWEFKGVGQNPELHKEELGFEHVKLTTRSYK